MLDRQQPHDLDEEEDGPSIAIGGGVDGYNGDESAGVRRDGGGGVVEVGDDGLHDKDEFEAGDTKKDRLFQYSINNSDYNNVSKGGTEIELRLLDATSGRLGDGDYEEELTFDDELHEQHKDEQKNKGDGDSSSWFSRRGQIIFSYVVLSIAIIAVSSAAVVLRILSDVPPLLRASWRQQVLKTIDVTDPSPINLIGI